MTGGGTDTALRADLLREYLGKDADRFTPELHAVLGSTNDRARACGAAGAPAFTVILADRQEHGRGRLRRPFFSPPGVGLYLSVLLRPRLEAALCPRITPFAAVAVCRALAALFPGIRPGIKWVNDVYLSEKKLCGILTESVLSSDGGVAYAVLGIGVNVGKVDFPEPLRPIASSLANEGYGGSHTRERLAAAILRELLSYEEAIEADSFYDAYRERLILSGRRVAVYGADGAYLFTGTAEDIERDFSLRVRDEQAASAFLRQARCR